MKTKVRFLLLFVFLTACVTALAAWYKLFRVEAQPAWIAANARDNFLYGSVEGNEKDGIPYWIWLALPRRFPEYLPGPGGYASLGFPWEETFEMPVGFAKQTVGYVRVSGNCAMCHAYAVSNGPDAAPTVFAAGPGHTAEVRKLLDFYKACAQDPRFDAENLLDEISMATKLSLVDSIIYRYILIPRTRKQLLQGDAAILDQAMWQHSQNPGAQPTYRQTLKDLDASLHDAEKTALDQYLQTLR